MGSNPTQTRVRGKFLQGAQVYTQRDEKPNRAKVIKRTTRVTESNEFYLPANDPEWHFIHAAILPLKIPTKTARGMTRPLFQANVKLPQKLTSETDI